MKDIESIMDIPVLEKVDTSDLNQSIDLLDKTIYLMEKVRDDSFLFV